MQWVTAMLWEHPFDPRATKFRINHQRKQGGPIVKKTIVTLACTLIASLAFAQTSATTKQTTTKQPKTTTETATTYTSGTVTKYEPGKTIVIQSNLAPVSFALGTAVRIVDGTGHVVTSVLKPGERVLVYYTGTGNTRTVEHIVAED
jgi:cytoskeletal protein RodZ